MTDTPVETPGPAAGTPARETPTMWRRRNDSTDLAEPRPFLRVYTGPGTLDAVAASYERLLGTERDMWFAYPEKHLALAVVGAFLLIEGTPETLEPFRATHGTLLVDSAQAYLDRLVAEGAEITDPLIEVPTGSGFTARHRDGTVIEYVEHRPTAEGL
ncbi:VOC family protein [Streptomyces sp. NPDC002564]|uniref:VOC family protein n=1 Tax=Streptomyces sp. NPDC002564 TaxID=3364649 RepID=UPI0036C1CA02